MNSWSDEKQEALEARIDGEVVQAYKEAVKYDDLAEGPMLLHPVGGVRGLGDMALPKRGVVRGVPRLPLQEVEHPMHSPRSVDRPAGNVNLRRLRNCVFEDPPTLEQINALAMPRSRLCMITWVAIDSWQPRQQTQWPLYLKASWMTRLKPTSFQTLVR